MLDMIAYLRRIMNADVNETFDPATDSLEAIGNALGAPFHGPFDFWSVPQEELSIPAVAATRTLPTVTVAGLPAGATIVRAIAIVKFRMIENTNVAANKLDGATVAATSQVIQVNDSAATGWVDAINFVDDQFGLGIETREGGDALMGSIDIAARVDGNDTYSFRYLLAKADLASINWNDLQTGLRIWYSS